MGFWLKIYICQSSMVHEGCCMNFLTRVGNLEASTVCWREATRRAQLSRYQAAVDRVCRVAVDLMLIQEDKPKRHWSAREISHSLFKCTQKNNSPWSPAHMLQTTSCSAVVWSQSHFPSHSLINNLIVRNKSCYSSIINDKLNNK